MKTAEAKTTSTLHQSQTGQPFFQKEGGESVFFSNTDIAVQTKLFFDAVEEPIDTGIDTLISEDTDHGQDGGALVRKTDSSVTETPSVQTKCAECEQEEEIQKKEEESEELVGQEPEIQEKPIFESEAEPVEEPIQTKTSTDGLTIGQPDDKYEQEADAMANQVVRKLSDPEASVEKEPEEVTESEPEIQEKPIFESEAAEESIQTKPIAESISNVDPTQVASETTVADATSSSTLQTKCAECEQEEQEEVVQEQPELQKKPIFDSVEDPPDDDQPNLQRFTTSIDSIDGNSGNFSEVLERTRSRFTGGFLTPFTGSEKIAQKKEEAGSVSESKPSLKDQLDSSASRGTPLDDTIKDQMESGFGADFSDVNIHTDSGAVEMNKGLNAQAFTHGSDIYFNQGKYNPETSSGKHLLAHELTHTVQQSGESIKRREFGSIEDVDEMVEGDWTHAGRLNKTDVWKDANVFNLETGRSSQYTEVDVRRDFYLWFYETTREKGHEVKWPLAAFIVAGGANEAANRDPLGLNFIRNNELEQLLRRGNQVIFDDVFPKLRRLYFQENILTGVEALGWDMQILIQEQNLIQPLYTEMSQEDLQTMNCSGNKDYPLCTS